MKIKITIKKEKIVNVNKKTPIAFLISFIYVTIIGLLLINKLESIYLYIIIISGMFYFMLQIASYLLSGKYIILNSLYGGRVNGLIFVILLIIGITMATYAIVRLYLGGP